MKVVLTFACQQLIVLLNIAYIYHVYCNPSKLARILSSSGSNRTKKGRQALTQKRTGGRLSSLGQSSNYSNTTDSTLSTIFQKTQSSSTQTDMRDSEIQTDPWWYRSEGTDLAITMVYLFLYPFLWSNKHSDVTGCSCLSKLP